MLCKQAFLSLSSIFAELFRDFKPEKPLLNFVVVNIHTNPKLISKLTPFIFQALTRY